MTKKTVRRASRVILSAILALTFTASSFISLMPARAAEEAPLKKRVTYYTEEERANILENVERYDWAKEERDGYVSRVEPYLEKGLDYLWHALTSNGVLRSPFVNPFKGCLNCGEAVNAYGDYPYKYDILNDPWKITCPACGMRFPTNDFGAYYESGLDEDGCFDRERADPQYLKNVLYPERGEDWGVDDGLGYWDEEGNIYSFVVYYNHEAVYRYGFAEIIEDLAGAYLYTGEQKYADAGIVILDRLAFLYPDMDLKHLPDMYKYTFPVGGKGKIMDCIWECTNVLPYLRAYDAFFPAYDTMSEEAKALIEKVSHGERTTSDQMRVHVENGFVKEVYPNVTTADIYGNPGMHQLALATAAVVIDDPELTKEWMDFNMRPGSHTRQRTTGGDLLSFFTDTVDRDGYGDEAAPGYNSDQVSNFMGVADVLQGYKIGGTGESYDLYENVKFRKMIYSFIDLILCNRYSPPIGDSGYTGLDGIWAKKDNLLRGYLVYGDDYLAQALYLVNGNKTDGLRLPAEYKDPEGIADKIQKVIDEKGPLVLDSVNLTAYGYAVTRSYSSAGAEDPDSEPRTDVYSFDSLELLRKDDRKNLKNGKDGSLVFSGNAGATASFGFRIPDAGASCGLAITSGGGNEGVVDVYVDGRLFAQNVSLSGSEDETRTEITDERELTEGYHVLTLRLSSGGPVDLKTLEIRVTPDGKRTKNKETSMYMYYGRTDAESSHGHADTLNLGLYTYNNDLMPDIGYPQIASSEDEHNRYFVTNTVSHNTVMVDEKSQYGILVGTPELFDSSDIVKLISVDGKDTYDNLVTEYKRTAALIKIADGMHYIVDFFNVSGGTDHTYILHGAETDEVSVIGLTLEKQVGEDGEYVGTMAGPEYGIGGTVLKSGYQFFDKVRRDNDPSDNFSVDWSIVDSLNRSTADDVHLRVTVLGDYDSVTLADGHPPTNKFLNPESLTYLFVDRRGEEDITTVFNSVIEPYTGTSKIASVEKIPVYYGDMKVDDNEACAVKVTHMSGRVDYIAYNSSDLEKTLSVDGVFEFTGSFAFCAVAGDEKVIYASGASVTGVEDVLSGRLTGKVTDFTKEMSTENSITVTLDSNIDPAILAGQYVYIDRSENADYNACYRIVGATKADDGSYVLDVGDVTTIEYYINSKDPDSGYIYSIEPESGLYIPLSFTSGDPQKLYALASEPVFSDIVLSADIKSDAAPGDFISDLYAVNASAKNTSEIVSCAFSVDAGYGDGEMFEIKDNKLYASSSFTGIPDGQYDILIKADYGEEEKTLSWRKAVTLKTLSEADSAKLVYPGFDLTPDPETGSEGTSPAVIWTIVGIIVAIAAIALIVIIVSRSKKKAA